jgi:hypothetical protein
MDNVYIPKAFTLVKLLNIKNGCCPGRPVVLVRSCNGFFSTQCACGLWCSNGHEEAETAIEEYERMNKGLGLFEV